MDKSHRPTLPVPCLCLVTDRRLRPNSALADAANRAVDGGCAMVQLREKDLPRDAVVDLARELRAAIRGRALLIVNGDPEAALAAGAEGLHLGEASMSILEARRAVGNRMLIGRSVHSVESAVLAEEEGADYLIVGTMFETGSHPGKSPEGLPLMRRVRARVHVPLIGIGGINASNAASVMEAGASGVAVISAILSAPDPRVAAADIVAALGTASPRLTPSPSPSAMERGEGALRWSGEKDQPVAADNGPGWHRQP